MNSKWGFINSFLKGKKKNKSPPCCVLLYRLRLQEMVRRGEILDDSMEDEFYLRRLDAGLFVLQLLCYIMVEISSSGVSQVHTHTIWLFK